MSGQDLVPANNYAPLVHGMTIDLTQDSDDDAPAAAAAADPESSEAEEEEEEETLAQRVKRRGDRKQREHHAGSYQNMETQQALASEEMARLADMLEVRDVEGMGSGLFARRDLPKGFSLSYFGRHYPGFSHYLKDYPQDDGAYTMEHRGEFFDATPIEQLGKYVNHSRRHRNLAFTDDEDSPFVRLELTKKVRAGQQLFTDYGPSYNYVGFSRDD